MAQSPLPARTFAAMTFADIAQMIAALAVTLGFFGLGVWALRKYGPEFTRKLSAARGDRRLAVIETLILDQKSRLVLVRVDGAERLILIGQGQAVEHETRKASS